MRCLVIVAIALALAACASAEKEQEKAKVLEDRWPQCSQVVNGRLGAFHPFNTNAGADWAPKCTNYVPLNDYDAVSVNYKPCMASVTTGSVLSIVSEGDGYSVASFSQVEMNGKQFVSYTMPTKKGDTPHFTGMYLGTYSGSPATATVTTQCNTGMADETILISKINITSTTGQYEHHFDVVLESKYACPLFPYTGKSVPPGGVAAIVIVILCFVFQFGICAWYRKTQVVAESPFTGAEEYTNVE